jgi:hypothetical protein
MEKSKNITIVIPIKGQKDALRYQLILEPTLSKVNAEVMLITDEDFDNAYPESTFDFQYLKSGWLRQQLIKLFVSQFVKTPWYLCLDSDCFFTKRGNIDSLFLTKDKSKAFFNEELDTHSSWWEQAKDCLGLKSIPEIKCGVTPMMIKTELCKDLCNSYNVKRISKFLNSGATEYCLYWSYCKPYKYYESKTISQGVFDADVASRYFVNNPDCYFHISNLEWNRYPVGLVQSTLKHNPFKLKKALSKYL